MKKPRLLDGALFLSYGVLWIGGVIHYAMLGPSSAKGRWGSLLLLSLATAIILSGADRVRQRRLLFCGLVGLSSEIIGVRYGIPYGRYAYTDQLATPLLGVPWVMGCAWMTLFAYIKGIIDTAWKGASWRPWIGAAWMVGIDLLIEPLAAGPLSFWKWQDAGSYHGIPWTNFAGWFGVSLLLFLLFREPWPQNNKAIGVGLSMVFFFVLIGTLGGFWKAALPGLGLLALHFIAASGRLIPRNRE